MVIIADRARNLRCWGRGRRRRHRSRRCLRARGLARRSGGFWRRNRRGWLGRIFEFGRPVAKGLHFATEEGGEVCRGRVRAIVEVDVEGDWELGGVVDGGGAWGWAAGDAGEVACCFPPPVGVLVRSRNTRVCYVMVWCSVFVIHPGRAAIAGLGTQLKKLCQSRVRVLT